MNIKTLIGLWRDRAQEARIQVGQMQDGSVAHEMMLAIAETDERLARWEVRNTNGLVA